MRFRTLVLLSVATLLWGCSTYDTRYAFDSPVEVPVAVPGSDGARVRTLVSVMGVHNADKHAGIPRSVEVRLRIENTSPARVSFNPRSMVLLSAGLVQFPDPILRPPGDRGLDPGQSAMIQAFFPLGEWETSERVDLSGLNLQWTLEIDDRTLTQSASFIRLPTAYYDRYPNRIGVGYWRYDC